MGRSDTLPPTPSGLPLLGNTAQFVRDPFGFIRESVVSTGDVFRMRLLGKDVYVLAHPDFVETALSDRDVFTKLGDFEVAFGEALLSVHGDQWRRQRHAMEEFFSPSRIREHIETMIAIADSRIDTWRGGETVRIDEWTRLLALENLFEVVLGQSVSDEELGELAEAAHTLNLWFKPSSWSLPDWLPTPARREFHRGSAKLREYSEALLDESGETPDEDSLLATLAALCNDPQSEFDRSEVLDQVVGMVFAGHETTALAMTYALHQIASRPGVTDRFYAELDEVLDGTPSAADLQELEYLEQVIDETLRLYPPVHAIPRVTTEEVNVNGYTIPADAPVLLSVWSLHRDPRFWDDPLAFDPPRWAEASPRERGYAYIPFGAGLRICIGRHFARLELKTVLAMVGQQYHVNTTADLDVTPKMTTQPNGPVSVQLTERR